MTIRSIHANEVCAKTFARLDDSITVAHTDTTTLLLNMPRDIDALAEVTGKAQKDKNWFRRLEQLFAG